MISFAAKFSKPHYFISILFWACPSKKKSGRAIRSIFCFAIASQKDATAIPHAGIVLATHFFFVDSSVSLFFNFVILRNEDPSDSELAKQSKQVALLLARASRSCLFFFLKNLFLSILIARAGRSRQLGGGFSLLSLTRKEC